VLVILAVMLVAVLPPAGTGATSPSPSGPASPAPSPRATRSVDSGAVEVVLTVNRRLAEAQRLLQLELATGTLDVPAIQSILRGMNPQLRLGIDAAGRLMDREPSRPTATGLIAFYEELRTTIDRTLEASVRNEATYRDGSAAIVAHLAELTAFDEALAMLLTASPPPSAGATSSPTQSASPTPIPTPATPSPSPAPSVSATPIMPSPSNPPMGDNRVVNGGFEGSIPPWQIEIAAGAAAEGALDPSNPASGATSLRVTIVAGSPSRAGISVRQGGMLIVPGSRYLLSVRARSEAIREIRIGVTSVAGGTYASTLAVVGTGWSALALEFLAIAGDDEAIVTIDLGRDTATTWLDDVSFGPIGP
jgi:hypothetical protein